MTTVTATNAVVAGRPTKIRAKLGSIAATDVYTCPASHFSRVIALRCINTSAGSIDIIVTIVDTGAVSYTFLPLTPLDGLDTIDFDLSGHPLQATEKVQVQASGADTIQVIGVAMETARSAT